MDESLANCRLCNYKSDQRLMLNVFEEPISYSEKIESYLDLKVNIKNETKIMFKSNLQFLLDPAKRHSFINMHLLSLLSDVG